MSEVTDPERMMLAAWTAAAAIIHRLGRCVTAREFGRHNWRFRQVPRSMLESMAQRGYGRWKTMPSGPLGGRPKRFFILADDIDETGVRRSKISTAEVLS